MFKSLFSLGFLGGLPYLLTATPASVSHVNSNSLTRRFGSVPWPDNCWDSNLLVDPFWVGSDGLDTKNYCAMRIKEGLVTTGFNTWGTSGGFDGLEVIFSDGSTQFCRT